MRFRDGRPMRLAACMLAAVLCGAMYAPQDGDDDAAEAPKKSEPKKWSTREPRDIADKLEEHQMTLQKAIDTAEAQTKGVAVRVDCDVLSEGAPERKNEKLVGGTLRIRVKCVEGETAETIIIDGKSGTVSGKTPVNRTRSQTRRSPAPPSPQGPSSAGPLPGKGAGGPAQSQPANKHWLTSDPWDAADALAASGLTLKKIVDIAEKESGGRAVYANVQNHVASGIVEHKDGKLVGGVLEAGVRCIHEQVVEMYTIDQTGKVIKHGPERARRVPPKDSGKKAPPPAEEPQKP